VIKQLAPPATLLPQVLVWEKSAAWPPESYVKAFAKLSPWEEAMPDSGAVAFPRITNFTRASVCPWFASKLKGAEFCCASAIALIRTVNSHTKRGGAHGVPPER
jgi:hypothetical protein